MCFPGQYYDQETNLHYNHFRYYDPTLGRYLTSDPIGVTGGLNTYSYAIQNPITNVDPLGLSPFPFPYKPDPKIDRPGPIDQSGRTGRTGRPVSGPFNRPPTTAEKVGDFLGNQLIKRILDSILPGAGKLFGSARGVVGINAIIYSPALNEGEFGNDSPSPDIPIPDFNPLPDYNSPDPVSDPIRDLFCQLNPGAPNCQVEKACE